MADFPRQLSIGDVARRSGLAITALRYYEEAGILEPPARAGGQRRYDESVLDRLSVIAAAKEAGFSLAEVRALLTGFDASVTAGERWRQFAATKIAEIDARIERAHQMRGLLEHLAECDCRDLDECGTSFRHASPGT